MGSVTWGQEIAEIYDKTYAAKFEPSVLGPVLDLLAGLARGGAVVRARRPVPMTHIMRLRRRDHRAGSHQGRVRGAGRRDAWAG